ncbi:MAG: leucine-rich repeat domain-containing protein [Alkaliphilus sp.]
MKKHFVWLKFIGAGCLILSVILFTGCTLKATQDETGEDVIKEEITVEGKEEKTMCDVRDKTEAKVEDIEIVNIPDRQLMMAIQRTLGKSSKNINIEDIKKLTELETGRGNITDLTGLEYAINLTKLDLRGNSIVKLEALRNLAKLEVLQLSNNQIVCIMPLSGLYNLINLELMRNQVSEIESLSNLTNLVSLNLFNNKILNVSALTNLTKLDKLFLHRNQIGDLSPLIKNEGLKHKDDIWLANNPATTILDNEVLAVLERINNRDGLISGDGGYNEKVIELPSEYLVSEPKTLIFSGGFEDEGYIKTFALIENGDIEVTSLSTARRDVRVFKSDSVERDRKCVLFKEPLKKGVNWVDAEGNQIIVLGTNVEITVPAGTFETIEILRLKEGGFSTVRNFALGLGQIRAMMIFYDGEYELKVSDLMLLSELIFILE